MSEIFLEIANRSIAASWLVLAVLVLRFLLKKAPKWVNVLLWGLVAVRLLCPISIESSLSLIPDWQIGMPEIVGDHQQTAVGQLLDSEGNVISEKELGTGTGATGQILDSDGNTLIEKPLELQQDPSEASPLTRMYMLSSIWLAGILIMSGYTLLSYFCLKRRVSTSVPVQKGIRQCEYVESPFVLGIVRPRIYLPCGMDAQSMTHVIAHEQAHIRRKDHWWKPLGFLLLTIHWFNPLMWVAYILLCRDIELACDEKVIKELGNEQRADYSQALVLCSISRRRITACPLAFGEVGVKERVKNVMIYRKPAFRVIASALIVCALTAVCFLTSPERADIYDIYEQNGHTVIGQYEAYVTLCVDKAKLPDSIYTAEGYAFDEDEVIAYSTETSRIYLRNAMLSNESDDLLYFTFDFSYDLPKSGSIISPFKHIDDSDGSQYNLYLQSEDLRDRNTSHPEAVDIRAYGPGTQFAFYVSREACQAADGVLMIDVVCNQIDYTSEPGKLLKASVLEVRDGFFLVEPAADSQELRTADRIEVPMKNMYPSPEIEVGDVIEIAYYGELMETYPARIGMVSGIRVVVDAPEEPAYKPSGVSGRNVKELSRLPFDRFCRHHAAPGPKAGHPSGAGAAG